MRAYCAASIAASSVGSGPGACTYFILIPSDNPRCVPANVHISCGVGIIQRPNRLSRGIWCIFYFLSLFLSRWVVRF